MLYILYIIKIIITNTYLVVMVTAHYGYGVKMVQLTVYQHISCNIETWKLICTLCNQIIDFRAIYVRLKYPETILLLEHINHYK